MITSIKIEWFKSIRSLELQCRRVNLFIGEPNSGKSNILEALGVLSWLGWGGNFADFVRARFPHEIFFDFLTDREVRICCEGEISGSLTVACEGEQYVFRWENRPVLQMSVLDGRLQLTGNTLSDFRKVCKFRFAGIPEVHPRSVLPLLPPKGENLCAVIAGSESLRKWLAELFGRYGYTVVIPFDLREITVQKRSGDVSIGYPLSLTSETLQRIVFHYAAIETHPNSVLIFEEPEAHAFPYFTKYLGEKIGADRLRQYFISTHNPYFLSAVLEKAPRADVAVFATVWREYATQVISLSEEHIAVLLDQDPFFALEHVLEGA